MIEEGRPAPDFELPTDAGDRLRLSSLRGRPVVLYFYPKDDTPGCTAQACGLRDDYGAFEERGAVVLGVSADTETSHKKFKEKHGRPLTLRAAPHQTLPDVYGVGREGSHSYQRSTFVIDADGNIAKFMRSVKPDAHVEQVLAALPG